MLRVGLDTSPLALTKAGTARYLTNIVGGLDADPELELRRYDWGGDGKATRVVRDTGWYRFTLPRAAKRDGVQVLHCPTMRAPFRSPVPLVVTIHDAAVLRHPDAFNRWTRNYSARSLPRVVRSADRIVTGSAFTRDELVQLLEVPENKIRVIPYGVGAPFTEDGPAAEGAYILAVSTLEPRKNLSRLVEGFHRSDLDGLELRIVGAEGWGGVSVGGGDRVRRLTGVDDEELARLYRGAAAVAYVSLYEGFGLPVLEAMACARPVVAPAGRPFSEFADGVAFEVDPRDPDSIADGLRRAVAAGHQAVGARRAADYSWERAVQAHVDLYRELAG